MTNPALYNTSVVQVEGRQIIQLTYLDINPRMVATLTYTGKSRRDSGLEVFDLCLGSVVCRSDSPRVVALIDERTPKITVNVHEESILRFLGMCAQIERWPARMGIAIASPNGSWRVSGLKSILDYIKVQGIEGHTLAVTYEQ